MLEETGLSASLFPMNSDFPRAYRLLGKQQQFTQRAVACAGVRASADPLPIRIRLRPVVMGPAA